MHEALVDLETFVQAEHVGQRRERSRAAAGIDSDPQAKRVALHDLPDEVTRRLFEALRPEIHYDPERRTATCRLTLVGETINTVAQRVADNLIPFPTTTTSRRRPT